VPRKLDVRNRAQSGLRVGDIILAIDGVPVIDPNDYPPIRGPIGSHITLRVLRAGLNVSQEMSVTMKRGRAPKSAGMSAAMPGIQVLALISQGPKSLTYKVRAEKPGGGEANVGIMTFDLVSGKGTIIMPTDEKGEDPLGAGRKGPTEEALAECFDRAAKIQMLTSQRKWNRIVDKEEEIRSIVAKFEATWPSISDKAQQREADSRASDLMNALAVGLHCQKRHAEAVVAGKTSLHLAERACDDEAMGFALSGLGDALDSSGR
jgi:hypothetical protein